MSKKKKSPAVFLDRDGTILNERGYLSDPKKLNFYPTAFQALRTLSKAGFKLVVVTNQSGIGRGYLDLSTLKKIHQGFSQKLRHKGVKVSGIYFCPDLPNAGCACRKPKPGMIKKAAKDLMLDIKKSYVVGDQARDVELAWRVGAKGVLVLTGAGKSVRKKATPWAAKISSNLRTAAKWILKDHERKS